MNSFSIYFEMVPLITRRNVKNVMEFAKKERECDEKNVK